MYLAERIMFQIDDILNEDMLNEYYHLPKKVYEAIHELKFEDIKRTDASTDKSSNNDHDEESVSEDIESNHQDSASQGGAYLEMELHEGENSEVVGDNDTARATAAMI